MVKDCRHVEIKVGDTVVYPGRRSSGLWMNTAKVLEVQDCIPRSHRDAPAFIKVEPVGGGRFTRVYRLERVAVVEHAVVTNGLLASLTPAEKSNIKQVRFVRGLVWAIRQLRDYRPAVSLLEAKQFVEGL